MSRQQRRRVSTRRPCTCVPSGVMVVHWGSLRLQSSEEQRQTIESTDWRQGGCPSQALGRVAWDGQQPNWAVS